MKQTLSIVGVLLLAVISVFTSALSAGAATSNSTLPTRPPTATPLPPAGSLIVLSLQATQAVPDTLWTIIQWQDAQDNWHNVEGWQGNFNERLEVVWWVAPEDLDKGPFRWVVYEQQSSDEIVGVSESFNLPSNNKVILEIEITLP